MTNGIKTWTFEFHVIPGRGVPDYEDQQLVQQTFDRNLRRLVELEGYGFEGVFFSEHHFLNSLSPVPNLLIAALAKMTTRFRLGVMGNVLPFHQPWRLAEELATLDYLSDGRLEIGAASGIPPEFLFVGMPPQEIRPRYGEILDFLGLATEHKHVSFHGELLRLRGHPLDAPAAHRGAATSLDDDLQPRDGRRVPPDATTRCAPATSRPPPRRSRSTRIETPAQTPAATARPTTSACVVRCSSASPTRRPKSLHAELLANDQKRIEAVFAEVFARVQRTTAAEQIAPSQQSSGVMDAAAVPGGGSQAEQGRSPVPGGGGGLNIDAASEYLYGSPSTVADKIVEQLRFIGAGNILQYHAQSMTEDELDLHYKLFSTIVPVLASANVSVDA